MKIQDVQFNSAGDLEKLSLQIYPSKIRVELNDKATKKYFNFSDEVNADLHDGGSFSVIEKKNHKKHGKVRSKLTIHNAEGYSDTSPLTQFDRAVFAVCVSEWLAGNRYTTPAIIYRGLTGKIDKGIDAKPSTSQREAILESVRKMMAKIITSDISELCEYMKYNNGAPITFTGPVLPACYVTATVGGHDATVIFFLAQSPLLNVADIKGQILRYDPKLLDIPNQNNSQLNITAKNYVMCRVLEIIAHKELKPILTFADIFKKCRIENAHREIKSRARDFVVEFFQHLKDNGVIKDFEVTKKGNKFYSINFTY